MEFKTIFAKYFIVSSVYGAFPFGKYNLLEYPPLKINKHDLKKGSPKKVSLGGLEFLDPNSDPAIRGVPTRPLGSARLG